MEEKEMTLEELIAANEALTKELELTKAERDTITTQVETTKTQRDEARTAANRLREELTATQPTKEVKTDDGPTLKDLTFGKK